jgi:NAD(P)-dependent dehydrogenase (short-subunit alcohol dehydrogenase family)
MPRFTDKRAVVTGAASGIGAAAARRLADEGCGALALLDENAAGLTAIASEIGARAVALTCDISDPRQVAAAWSTIDRWGALDVLITAAAVLGPVTGVIDCPPDAWDRVFAINVRGTYLAARHAVPLMRANGRGSIVTISSAGGLIATPALGPYGGSKAAVIQITRSLAVAHAADNIRANCVCPGPVDTPMLRERLVDSRDVEKVRTRVRLNRFGKPEEIVEAILFFASDAASFATGAALLVDGGELA